MWRNRCDLRRLILFVFLCWVGLGLILLYRAWDHKSKQEFLERTGLKGIIDPGNTKDSPWNRERKINPKSCPPNSPLIKQLRRLKSTLFNRTREDKEEEALILAEKGSKKTVLLWHRATWTGWGHQGWVDWAFLRFKKDYPEDCEFNFRTGQHKKADLILFDLFAFMWHKGDQNQSAYCYREFPFPAKKPSYQKWGTFHYEQYRQFPAIAEAELIEMFDVHLNYTQKAAVPISLTCPWLGQWQDYFEYPDDVKRVLFPSNKEPPPKIDRKLVSYFGSRCTPNREKYIKELMKYIPVHSYGKCMNNANMTEEKPNAAPRNWKLKIKELRKFKFNLAFENGDIPEYVTEKLPQAYLAGTVPIYKGTDAIRWQVPPHSFIMATDFETPKDLADYLLELDRDDKKYAKYFEWKKDGAKGGFKKRMDECIFTAEDRICKYLGSKGSVNVTISGT